MRGQPAYRVPRRNEFPPANTRGNCHMCSRAGQLGRPCRDNCQENDPLANKMGEAVPNDSTTLNARCRYKVMYLPDRRTALSPDWYETAVIDGESEGQVVINLARRLPAKCYDLCWSVGLFTITL